MPFVSEYAEYDLQIVSHFLNTFREVISESVNDWMDDTPQVFASWAGGISRTVVGTHMAHMMKSCLMAKEGLTAPLLVIRADGKYEGSILLGKNIAIRHVGGEWVQGKDADGLRDDLKDLNSHQVAVRRILEAVGMVTSDPSQFTTLRSLSLAINATGEPSGMAKNIIQRHLPHTSFLEGPEKVNASTILAAIGYLSSEDRLPESLYMDKGSFFPKNRYEEVLCAFGSSVPSFNYGGIDTKRCCDVEGKGIPKEIPYSRNDPPVHLQVKLIAIGPAVSQWEDMMKHGVIRGNFGKVDRNSREFLGEEKTRIWLALDDQIRKTIIPKGAVAGAQQIAGGGLVKRIRDDKEVEDRKSKKNRLFG